MNDSLVSRVLKKNGWIFALGISVAGHGEDLEQSHAIRTISNKVPGEWARPKRPKSDSDERRNTLIM